MTNFEQNPDYYEPVFINDVFPHLRDVPKQTEGSTQFLESVVLDATSIPYEYSIVGNRIHCMVSNDPNDEHIDTTRFFVPYALEVAYTARFHDSGTGRYANMLLLDYMFVELLKDITNDLAVWKYRCGKSRENIGKLLIFPYNTSRVTSDVNYVVMRSGLRQYDQHMAVGDAVDLYTRKLFAQIHLWPASRSHTIYFIVPCYLSSQAGIHAVVLVFSKVDTIITSIYVLDSNISFFISSDMLRDADRMSYLKGYYSSLFASIKKSTYFLDTTPIRFISNGWQTGLIPGGDEYVNHSCGLMSVLLLSRFVRNIYIHKNVFPADMPVSEVAKINELVMMRRLIKNEFERAASERYPLITPTYAERTLYHMVDLTGKRIYKYDYKKHRLLLPFTLGVNSLTLANPGLDVYYLINSSRSRMHEPSLNEVILLDTFMTEEESKKKVKATSPILDVTSS
jgi:hypothetical protein